ncbi:MAG TPA: PilC/PilY family type IV pilus protein [Paucimonas sp.]|nr:PilC/PilY family type IV pilus protein [Paucimonas sp.]
MRTTFLFSGFVLALAAGAAAAPLPPLDIADIPPYAGRVNVHPNVILSLSIEYPAAGIAYRGDNGLYDRTFEYVGYFNPAQCYRYVGGARNVVDGYFAIARAADPVTHECDGRTFSGNFMNWAVSSTLDMLRYALTGGDRVVDTADTTILQRAVLPEDFYANYAHFPRRILSAGGKSSAPERVTPFKVDKLHVVSCRNRILFSDLAAEAGHCDTPAYERSGRLAKTDKRLGEYLARVKVCDSAEGATRGDLCRRYGANYKPAGVLQRHAGRMRFAAMGYLLDDAATRYGGVLRVPMKHIGPKKFGPPDFGERPNDRAEWDAATGVLYRNPDAPGARDHAGANSGILNYLNQFGRGGIYKKHDPASELHYEAIRYLQGKQPTLEAAAGMTAAMKDGFPVIEGWSDPVAASCQRNYIVAIADAETHGDRYVPGHRNGGRGYGGARDPARPVDVAVAGRTPELDAAAWTRMVGEMEADTAGRYGNRARRPALANLDMLDTGAGGRGSYYMAGLAYWANTHDIRLDKPTRARTLVLDLDEGGNGRIDGSTRTVAPRDSQLYLAAKYGGFVDRNGDGNPFMTLAEDGKGRVSSDDEWSSDGGARPANYFLAGRPDVLIGAIRKMFADIAAGGRADAGAVASNAVPSADGARVYSAGFDASAWSGSLRRLRLLPDGTVAEAADWDAGEILTGGDGKDARPAPDARRIYTTRVDDGVAYGTVEFRWERLSPEQQALLDAAPDDGGRDGLGRQRVDFLRGVRNLEIGAAGGMFRARKRLLGDIVNSVPVYGAKPAAHVRGDGYADFAERHKGRADAVYVGANDGFLHAFAADDGVELFAYLPSVLLSQVNRLTSPDYEHRPFVDGAPAVAEARIGSQWRTVLASGMGGGAQGVFALDVTNPADFAGGLGALWEFTDADDAAMGNLRAAPAIAKFRVGDDKGVPRYRYFVVASSGWNNYQPDGSGRFDAKGAGALFLLALDKPAASRWREGVNYYKFKTPVMDDGLANALGPPALVVGGDGAVRRAYAGDLQGNLWRFDFTGAAPWSRALGSSPKPLFAARDAEGRRQPITARPRVVFAPGGGYLVLFGTGRLVAPADAAAGDFTPQSFYAVLDSAANDGTTVTRAQLAARSAARIDAGGVGGAIAVSGAAFRYGASEGGGKGWYLDFAASDKTGERSIGEPTTAYGRVFFNTVIPGADPCGAGGGRTYALDALTGMPPGGGTTGTPSAIVVNAPLLLETGPAETGERDAVGARVVKRRYTVVDFGSGAGAGSAEGGPPAAQVPAAQARERERAVEVSLSAGRLGWREVANWRELRHAAGKK